MCLCVYVRRIHVLLMLVSLAPNSLYWMFLQRARGRVGRERVSVRVEGQVWFRPFEIRGWKEAERWLWPSCVVLFYVSEADFV